MSEKTHDLIYAIAGPTGSGKTTLGVDVALRVGGEIVNFDSVQIYRGIEIATAKPTEEEQRGVPHHLFDYISPNVNYTAADWARDAAAVIEDIEARGRTPVLVGGTGFYLRTMMRPLFESPKTDERLRSRFLSIKERKGAEFLHRMLAKVDPESAEKLFPNDHVRVIRGLEVYFQTGEKLSARQLDRQEPPEFARRIKIFVLNPPRAELYERINARTREHFARGLVDEVRGLLASGVDASTNALGAHGYRRVCEFLRGERTLESAIEQTMQDVRHYSKRQLTWFRREAGAIWIDSFGSDAAAVEAVLRFDPQNDAN